MENINTILSIAASLLSIISLGVSTYNYYNIKSTRQINKNNSGTSNQAGGHITLGNDKNE